MRLKREFAVAERRLSPSRLRDRAAGATLQAVASIGKVVSVRGAVVDVAFDGRLPPIDAGVDADDAATVITIDAGFDAGRPPTLVTGLGSGVVAHSAHFTLVTKTGSEPGGSGVKRSATFTVISGVGSVIGVAYTLRAIQKAFFGEAKPETAPAHGHDDESHEHHPLEPITVPERMGAAILIVASLVIGLFPGLLLNIIVPSFGSPLFDWLRKGGWQ